ncbi:MAG: Flp family type IVb pilin [Nitratireductor sp.]|nr:Flp family type IVb pilin [Nitratireductor sp.]
MPAIIRSFLKCTKGATAIEYALIASLISISIVAGATAIGGSLNDKFTEVNDGL